MLAFLTGRLAQTRLRAVLGDPGAHAAFEDQDQRHERPEQTAEAPAPVGTENDQRHRESHRQKSEEHFAGRRPEDERQQDQR